MSQPLDGDNLYNSLKASNKLDRLVLAPGASFRLIGTVAFTWDVGNLNDGAGETSGGQTVTGAALGDLCLVSAGVDLVDMVVTAYVQAANTVEVRVQNESGGAINLASTTFRVAVFRVT